MKFVLPTSLIAITLLASGVKARWKATPGLTWDYLLGASHSVMYVHKNPIKIFLY